MTRSGKVRRSRFFRNIRDRKNKGNVATLVSAATPVTSSTLREIVPKTFDDYSNERRVMTTERLKDTLETRIFFHSLVFVLKLVLFISLIVFFVQTLSRIVAKRVAVDWLRLRESVLNERFAENPNLYDFRFYIVDDDGSEYVGRGRSAANRANAAVDS